MIRTFERSCARRFSIARLNRRAEKSPRRRWILIPRSQHASSRRYYIDNAAPLNRASPGGGELEIRVAESTRRQTSAIIDSGDDFRDENSARESRFLPDIASEICRSNRSSARNRPDISRTRDRCLVTPCCCFKGIFTSLEVDGCPASRAAVDRRAVNGNSRAPPSSEFLARKMSRCTCNIRNNTTGELNALVISVAHVRRTDLSRERKREGEKKRCNVDVTTIIFSPLAT